MQQTLSQRGSSRAAFGPTPDRLRTANGEIMPHWHERIMFPPLILVSLAAVLAAAFIWAFAIAERDWESLTFGLVLCAAAVRLAWQRHRESRGQPQEPSSSSSTGSV